MATGALIMLFATTLGGLALFIYGMRLMGEGLQALAGGRVHRLLQKFTANRLAALSVGGLSSLLIRCGPTTVLLAGFINAGLLSFAASVPVILGANVGTTLSMQLLSFKVGQYSSVVIAAGTLVLLSSKRVGVRHLGQLILGLGLMFLGMTTMGDSLGPLKDSDSLKQFLLLTHAASPGGLALGILVGTLITALLQSSGAMIGMLFALSLAGVFTDLHQVFPLILGAHIGACSATLLGSPGTSIEARRSVLAHVLFNVFSTLLAALMAPLYDELMPLLSTDMVHQIANAHTISQVFAALTLLPFTGLVAAAIQRLTPSRTTPAEKSHLDERLLPTPEMALVAVMLESRRMAVIARKMVRQSMEGFAKQREEKFAQVREAETSVNLLRDAINGYLRKIAQRQLSSRQSVLVQLLVAGVVAIERIADHAESVIRISREKKDCQVDFDDASMKHLLNLYTRADSILGLMASALDPANIEFEPHARAIIDARDAYAATSSATRDRYKQRVLAGDEDATAGMVYAAYLDVFDRIVEHARTVARVQTDPLFRVKPERFKTRSSPRPRRKDKAPEPSQLTIDTAMFDVNASGLRELLAEAPEAAITAPSAPSRGPR